MLGTLSTPRSPLDMINICDAGRGRAGVSDRSGANNPVWCLLLEDEPLLLLGISAEHDTISRCVHHIGIPPPYIQTPAQLAHSPQALDEICGIARHRHAELTRGGGSEQHHRSRYNASKPVKAVQGVAGQLVPIYTAILVLQADVEEVCDALRQYGVHPYTDDPRVHNQPPPQGTPTNPVIGVIPLSSSTPCRVFPGGLALHVGEAPPSSRDHDDNILYPRGAGYNMALTLEPRRSAYPSMPVGLLGVVCNTTVEEAETFSAIIQVCICSVVNLWRGCTIGGLRRLLVGPSDMPLRQVHLSGFAKPTRSSPLGLVQLHTDLKVTSPQYLLGCKLDSSLGLALHGCAEGDEFTIPQPLPPSNIVNLMPGQPDPNARLRYNFRPLALGDSLMASTATRSNVASRTQSRLEPSPNPVRPTTTPQQQHPHFIQQQQDIQISFDPPSATEESEGSSMASERVRELQFIADKKYGGSYAAAVRAKYLAAKGRQQLKAHHRVRALIGSSSSSSGNSGSDYSSSPYTSGSEDDDSHSYSSSSGLGGTIRRVRSVHHASVYSNAPTSAADRTLSIPTTNDDMNRTQSAAYRGERLADHVQHTADQIIIGEYPTELATMSDLGTNLEADVSVASRVPKSATSTVRRTPYSTPLSLDKVQEPLLSPFKMEGFSAITTVVPLPPLEDDMVEGEEYNSTPQRSARVVPTDSEISTEPTLEELVYEVDRHLKLHGVPRRSTPRTSPPANNPPPTEDVVMRREMVVEERSRYDNVQSEEREIVVVVPRQLMAVESRPWSVASGAPPRTAESPTPSSPDLCPGFTEEEGSRLGGRGDESDELADLPIDEDTHRTYHHEEPLSLPITRTNSIAVSRTQSKTVRFTDPFGGEEGSMARRVHSMNIAVHDEEEVALAMQEEDVPRLYSTLLAANAPEACELLTVVEHIPRAGQDKDDELYAEVEEEMVLEMQQEDLMRTYVHLLTIGAHEVLELLHVVKEDGGRLADSEEEPHHSGPPQYEDLPRLYDVLLRAGAPEACELLKIVAETFARLADYDEEVPLIAILPSPMVEEDQRRKAIEEEASPPAPALHRPVAKEEVAHYNTEEVVAVLPAAVTPTGSTIYALTPRRMFVLLPGTRPINLGRPVSIPHGSPPKDGLVVEGYSTHGFALEKLEGEAMAGEERARSLSPVLNRSSSQIPLVDDGGRHMPSPQHNNYHHTAPVTTTPRRTPRIGPDARPRVVAQTTPVERVFGTSRKLFVFENDSPRKPATTIMLRTAHSMQSFRAHISQRLGIMNLGDLYHVKGNRIVDLNALADGEPIVVCRRGGARFTPYNLPDQLSHDSR